MANRESSSLWRPRRFYESGPLALDALKCRAYIGDADLELTEKQFDALYLLVQREGKTMCFEDLYQAAWKSPDEQDCREEARQGMAGLLEKCAAMGKGEVMLETLPGEQFRFRRAVL